MFTALPTIGQVITQGKSLYAVNGTPVALLYGTSPEWRTLTEGVSGADVAQLNADLVLLGDATSSQLNPTSDYYSAATATAVKKLQADLGAAQTGSLALGQVVFLPTPLRITTVTPNLGSSVQAGAQVLAGTSTTRQITATVPATQLSQIKTGDPVTITLTNGHTTSGRIATIGRVATSSSSNSGGSSPPTVKVQIDATDPAATGNVDQATVTVAVTTATVKDALAVPATALVATADGRPAIDVLKPDGTTVTETVTLGLFDDANGLVQINGADLQSGQTVILPDQSVLNA